MGLRPCSFRRCARGAHDAPARHHIQFRRSPYRWTRQSPGLGANGARGFFGGWRSEPFPEQLREGLRPWSPLKVYAHVPFFEPTKDKKIYDYATDKYLPIRFENYVDKTFITEKPSTTLEVQEGKLGPGRRADLSTDWPHGLGFQKSQNGGGTTPPPGTYMSAYHRYGSRVPVAEKESSFYDGIDISLEGIATLTKGNAAFVKDGLGKISKIVDQACIQYRPDAPAAVAPALADGLQATRALLQQVQSSDLPEPGKGDVAFELEAKIKQFEKALPVALGISLDAFIAPEHEPDNRFGGGQAQTFTIAIPGQSFAVQANLFNEGPVPLSLTEVAVSPTDGKAWAIKAEKSWESSLAAGKEAKLKFSVAAPTDAALTKAYFDRPNREQPYYDIKDERFRNLSLAPYPLIASVRMAYRGANFEISEVVQANQRIEGVGMVQNPVLMGPAISISVSPSAGAVPLSSSAFNFSCDIHSNVKGAAKGTVRLRLPEGWQPSPAEAQFAFARDGDNQTITFQVTPHDIKARRYDIHAEALYGGKTFEEGYRLVGYPGVRPYPFYRPSKYEAVGVDVTTAPDLHVGFLPGTGDDVPRALEDLGCIRKFFPPPTLKQATSAILMRLLSEFGPMLYARNFVLPMIAC